MGPCLVLALALNFYIRYYWRNIENFCRCAKLRQAASCGRDSSEASQGQSERQASQQAVSEADQDAIDRREKIVKRKKTPARVRKESQSPKKVRKQSKSPVKRSPSKNKKTLRLKTE